MLHNNDLNQVTWEMRAMGGAPKFAESQTLPDVDYAGVRREPGPARAHRRRPRPARPAWEQALAADRPTVLDVHTDPDMPPIPPHATWEQFSALTTAMLKGDEDRWGFIKEGHQDQGAGIPAARDS